MPQVGLMAENVNGASSIQHSGGIFGYNTMGVYFPNEKVFVSGLANCDCNSVSAITTAIGAIAIGKPFPDKNNAVKLAEADLKKWIGAYQFEGNIVRHISLEKGQLYSLREGSSKSQIYPMSKTHFIFDGGNISYLFSVKDGKRQVAFTSNGNTTNGIETDKLPPAEKAPITSPAVSLSAEALSKYVGKYQLAPTVTLEIMTKGTQIFTQLTGQPPFEIFAEKEDHFFLKVVPAKLVFQKDASGKFTGVTLYQNGREIPAKKIE